jgi:hypothetical protein
VVVADKKTPTDWAYPNVDFLSVDMQKNLAYEIVPLVPYNNYGCAVQLSQALPNAFMLGKKRAAGDKPS